MCLMHHAHRTAPCAIRDVGVCLYACVRVVICVHRGRRTYVIAYVRARWHCRGVSVFVCTRVYVYRWTHMCDCNLLHVRTCICVCNILRVLSALPHTATHCNTPQHTAPHCTTLHHAAPRCTRLPQLQHSPADCNRLQQNTTHCNTLQHTATHCNTLQHTATYCNTLQHTATHCSTLQHTATHYTTHMTSPHFRTHPPPLIPAQPVDKECVPHPVAHCAYS